MIEYTQDAVTEALCAIADRAKLLTVGDRDLETEELTEEEAHSLIFLAGMLLLESVGAAEVDEGVLP